MIHGNSINGWRIELKVISGSHSIILSFSDSFIHLNSLSTENKLKTFRGERVVNVVELEVIMDGCLYTLRLHHNMDIEGGKMTLGDDFEQKTHLSIKKSLPLFLKKGKEVKVRTTQFGFRFTVDQPLRKVK